MENKSSVVYRHLQWNNVRCYRETLYLHSQHLVSEAGYGKSSRSLWCDAYYKHQFVGETGSFSVMLGCYGGDDICYFVYRKVLRSIEHKKLTFLVIASCCIAHVLRFPYMVYLDPATRTSLSLVTANWSGY